MKNSYNWPPLPQKIAIKYQNPTAEETSVYTKYNVQLWFAPSVIAVEFADKTSDYETYLTPENRGDRANQTLAILNVELFIPKREGPFPAIKIPENFQTPTCQVQQLWQSVLTIGLAGLCKIKSIVNKLNLTSGS